MKLISRIFNISFLVIAIIISFLNIFFGLDFLDTFYMGNLFSSDSIDILRPITNIVYIASKNLFGDYVIVYRILNWFIYLLSAVVLYKFLRSFNKISSIWLALTILSIPLVGTNVYNGNSLTLLGIVLTFIFLYKYVQSNNNYTLLGMILSLTLCLGSRFPNIVIIPFIVILSLVICYDKKQYFYILSAIFSSIILFFVINSIIVGGLNEYIIEIQNKFISSETHTGGANHSIAFLMQEYLHTIKDTVSNIKYLSILFIIPILSLLIKNNAIRYGILALFVFSNFIYIYFRIPVIFDVIHYFYMMYLYALVFIIVYICVVLSILTQNYKQLCWSLIILLFSAVGASGADTGIYYMGAPLFVFLPYLIYIIFSQLENINKKNLFGVLISLLGLSISCIFYVRDGMLFIGLGLFLATLCLLFVYSNISIIEFVKGKISLLSSIKIINDISYFNFLLPLFIVILITIGLYAEYNKPFHDKPVEELYTTSSIKELKYIATNPQSIKFINKIMGEYNKLSENNQVIFYGRNSAIFSYITHTGMIVGVDFTQDDSEYNIENVEKALNQNQVLILVPYNPAINNGEIIKDYPLLFNMMTRKGYSYELYADYTIFLPQKIE